MIVNNIDEAMSFFLNNSSKSCCCMKDGKSKICECYPDAVEFFNLKFNE